MSDLLQYSLTEGEEVVKKAEVSGRCKFFHRLVGFICILIGLSLVSESYPYLGEYYDNSPEKWFAAGAFLFFAGIAAFRRVSMELILTNKKLIGKQGIVSRRVFNLPLEKCESVVVNQGSFAGSFEFGDVIFRGTDGQMETFSMIHKPADFRQAVLEEIEKAKNPPPAKEEPAPTEAENKG